MIFFWIYIVSAVLTAIWVVYDIFDSGQTTGSEIVFGIFITPVLNTFIAFIETIATLVVLCMKIGDRISRTKFWNTTFKLKKDK